MCIDIDFTRQGKLMLDVFSLTVWGLCSFCPHDAMLAQVTVISTCPSVCPSRSSIVWKWSHDFFTIW